jgi:ABC-type multidrug transport system fused ATPase/permease subunit
MVGASIAPRNLLLEVRQVSRGAETAPTGLSNYYVMNSDSNFRLLFELWGALSISRRRQLMLLLLLMVLASIAEMLSIGAVLPFLGVLTAPEKVFQHPSAQPLIEVLNLSHPSQLLLPLTAAFGIAALLAGAIRLCLVWATTRLSFAAGADLSMEIYRRTLYQPYSVHVARNTSQVITGISNKTNEVIYGVMTPALNVVSSCFMLVAILLTLLAINTTIALSAFVGFGLIYLTVVRLTRKRLSSNGDVIARHSTLVIKCLQEGLGGIRDVLIDGTQQTFCEVYRQADVSLRRAQGNNQFIGLCPRYGVETLGMLLIAALAYVLARQEHGIASAIPVMGALALGAQRLLPVLQQVYGGWASIRGSESSLRDVLALLRQPLPEFPESSGERTPVTFSREIALKQLSFRYGPKMPFILQEVDLVIPKGSRVGFIGSTGSGKSTLLDLVMALLQPTAGTISVDGQPIAGSTCRYWQEHVAHVPQTIFLADTTIEENIAFGVPQEKIDNELVRDAARKAQLADTIENWTEGYQTRVGERGVRLSGGQRQRIGIARALYKRADVIIFDEATSALDTETERAVMQAIEALDNNLTILIIAHRLSTLSSCDRIVELNAGRVQRIGSYHDIVQHAP